MKVFGSGDLFDAETAVERLTAHGLDGVMIARGAIGNPWIFTRARALFEGRPAPGPPGIVEQGKIMLRHFEMIGRMYMRRRKMIKAVRYFRKFISGYCKHHPQRRKVQMALMNAGDKEQLLAAVKHWYGVG